MRLASVLLRIVIVFAWIGVLGAFLFAPYVTRLWSNKRTLNLCIWPMMIDPQVLAHFERETGIKVHSNYYENNEELYNKLKTTKGKGYDLIIPTDYIVQDLINDGLVKKIDTSRLDFMHTIKPYLLHHYYDPDVSYSIPYYVSVFGLGINKDYFAGQLPIPSWNLIFNPEYIVPPLCMTDGQRESIMLAAYYLYGATSSSKIIGKPHLKQIAQLLREQKKFVDVYSSARVDELLASGSCAVTFGSSPEVWKAMREYPNVTFVIPREGSFITIDSFVIPKGSTNDDLVYQLLNFLYRPDVMERNSTQYGFCPPTINVTNIAPGVVCLNEQLLRSMHFFNNPILRETMHELWIVVKS